MNMTIPIQSKGQNMDKTEFFYCIVTIVAMVYIGVLLAYRG